MDSKKKRKQKTFFENSCTTLIILCLVTLLCFFLSNFSPTDTHVPLLFVLAVLLVSRQTDGYIYGVVAAIIAVVGVNYIFTYPYFAIDFTITGYPLTFLVMLTVAIIVSAMTTQIKKQEQMRLDVEKEKMRANLLRAVSHDIRTPLTSIAGSAAAIMENYEVLPEDKVLELVGNVKDEAEWMVRMVENLLSITRMNSENANINTQEELVEEVIGGAILKFRKRFSNVSVETLIPEEVLLVPMDIILVEQVLVNLMENSVIHGKATKLTVNVEENGAYVRFVVKDNGNGIDEHILPVIFEGTLGEREGESSDSKRSMGIGLSVCKSIIKAHRGNMNAGNNESVGACMSFTLPLVNNSADGGTYENQR